MTSGARELIDEVAADHPTVVRRDSERESRFEASGHPFAVVRGSETEFRLRPEMVQAALRTPGTAESARGPEWVLFEPPAELESYDVDRLRSWFEMAARLAGG